MVRSIEVNVDEAGHIVPVEPIDLPAGRARLIWITDQGTGVTEQNECALMSEAALAKDWLTPEEDEAWAYIQLDK